MDENMSSKVEYELLRIYKDRFRVILILYYFSDDYLSDEHPARRKVFKGEIKIQAINFLIRYPDYLAYELMEMVNEGRIKDKEKIKGIVKDVFNKNEPIIRKEEMEKFFYGAYEDLDDVIAFFVSIGFLDFESIKRTDSRVSSKKYYLTENGVKKINKGIASMSSATWYKDRCSLIKEYFGDIGGSELKVRQYQVDEYKNTSLKDYIAGIELKTKDVYLKMFGESL